MYIYIYIYIYIYMYILTYAKFMYLLQISLTFASFNLNGVVSWCFFLQSGNVHSPNIACLPQSVGVSPIHFLNSRLGVPGCKPASSRSVAIWTNFFAYIWLFVKYFSISALTPSGRGNFRLTFAFFLFRRSSFSCWRLYLPLPPPPPPPPSSILGAGLVVWGVHNSRGRMLRQIGTPSVILLMWCCRLFICTVIWFRSEYFWLKNSLIAWWTWYTTKSLTSLFQCF